MCVWFQDVRTWAETKTLIEIILKILVSCKQQMFTTKLERVTSPHGFYESKVVQWKTRMLCVNLIMFISYWFATENCFFNQHNEELFLIIVSTQSLNVHTEWNSKVLLTKYFVFLQYLLVANTAWLMYLWICSGINHSTWHSTWLYNKTVNTVLKHKTVLHSVSCKKKNPLVYYNIALP